MRILLGILEYFERNRKVILRVLPVLTVLIGFNGYLVPGWTRVFGDTFPRLVFPYGTGFQYFLRDFPETLLPSFYAPYRYLLDYTSVFLEQRYSENFIQWGTVFVPFLLSTILCYYLFYIISRRTYWGYLVWFFYVFSTFNLFSSAIHTNIVTSINLVLFFFFLLYYYLLSQQNFKHLLAYCFFGFVSLVMAFTLELRMIIVTIPFFFFFYIFINWISFQETKKFKKNINGFCATLIILIMLGVVFSYIFSNIGLVSQQVNQATTRATWGNSYFSIINTLTLSHPFWNNGAPINFVYNSPAPIFFLNSILLVLAISFMMQKSAISVFLLFPPLLFFLTMSKQNNLPFENIYDYLYQYPYFSFSREASKYYYGYILSLSFIVLVLVRNLRYHSILSLAVLVCILVPSLNNFLVFASGKYGNSTRPYQYNIGVYSEINNEILELSGDQNTRVLWLPLKPSLQKDTDRVKHFSFTTLIHSNYPFNDLRRNSRSYMFESLRDENVSDFFKLFGIRYVVVPNLHNEPEMNNQLNIIYADLDIIKFTKYSENSLRLKQEKVVDGYKIYSISDSEQLDLSVFNSKINPLYGKIGDIVLSAAEEDKIEINNENLNSDTIKNIIANPSNCNSNSEKNLNFSPKDRIQLERNHLHFDISLTAKKEEVPCIFFGVDTLVPSDIVMNVDNYLGNETELVVYSGEIGGEINKIFLLNEKSKGRIEIKCKSSPCNISLYQYGNSLIRDYQTSLSFSFETVLSSTLKEKTNESIEIIDLNLKTLLGQELRISAVSDYVVFQYPYSADYVIKFQDKILKPIKNNHNLLIFRNPFANNFSEDINRNVVIFYEPEVSISRSLVFSRYAFMYFIIGMVVTFLAYLGIVGYRSIGRSGTTKDKYRNN